MRKFKIFPDNLDLLDKVIVEHFGSKFELIRFDMLDDGSFGWIMWEKDTTIPTHISYPGESITPEEFDIMLTMEKI